LAGLRHRAYVVAAAIYWSFCFFMSRYSQIWNASSTRTAALADEERAVMAENDTPMIEMRHVHKWFGDFRVLTDINLEVRRGERVVVCGPSGSGKSTMIRCINRLEEHQQARSSSPASS